MRVPTVVYKRVCEKFSSNRKGQSDRFNLGSYSILLHSFFTLPTKRFWQNTSHLSKLTPLNYVTYPGRSEVERGSGLMRSPQNADGLWWFITPGANWWSPETPQKTRLLIYFIYHVNEGERKKLFTFGRALRAKQKQPTSWCGNTFFQTVADYNGRILERE